MPERWIFPFKPVPSRGGGNTGDRFDRPPEPKRRPRKKKKPWKRLS
jgi:hypothetical protein